MKIPTSKPLKLKIPKTPIYPKLPKYKRISFPATARQQELAFRVCSATAQSAYEGVKCGHVEFDDIKVFYHTDMPEDITGPDAICFYIARPGAQQTECIDWKAEGIQVYLLSPFTNTWEYTPVLLVSPGIRVRIRYPFGDEFQIKELVFPRESPYEVIHLPKIPKWKSSDCPRAKTPPPEPQTISPESQTASERYRQDLVRHLQNSASGSGKTRRARLDLAGS